MEEPDQLKRALVDATAGAISGAISRTVTSPLDVIKIRFQVQLEPTTSWTLLHKDLFAPSKYKGMLQAAKEIFREEGLAVHQVLFLRVLQGKALGACPLHHLYFQISYGSSSPRLKLLEAFEGNAFNLLQPESRMPYKIGMVWHIALLNHPKQKIFTIEKFELLIGAAQHTANFQGFWRGNVPALLMVMPYTAIQFTVLHKFKTYMSGSSKAEDHIRLSPYLSYISGAVAGCAATIGSYPFDLVHTILASQGEPKVYPNMRAAVVGIYKVRGVQGLYAGLTPTLVEIIPYAGLQFGTYDTFKRWAMAWNQFRNPDLDDSPSSFQLFLCGLAAGTCAKAVCHPLDVIKKRFQIEGLQRDTRYGARVEQGAYKNMYDALIRILQTEGWAGLYKGIVPSIVKAAPAGAVTFVAYEYTSEWLESLLT